MICPVAAGQIRIGNRGAGIGGVDKLAVSGVDTHMGNAAGICTGEVYNITGFQIFLGNGSTHVDLVSRSAVRRIAQLLENIVHKSGAVKTSRGSAAVYIGGSQVFLCLCQDLSTGGISSMGSIAAGSSSQTGVI